MSFNNVIAGRVAVGRTEQKKKNKSSLKLPSMCLEAKPFSPQVLQQSDSLVRQMNGNILYVTVDGGVKLASAEI